MSKSKKTLHSSVVSSSDLGLTGHSIKDHMAANAESNPFNDQFKALERRTPRDVLQFWAFRKWETPSPAQGIMDCEEIDKPLRTW